LDVDAEIERRCAQSLERTVSYLAKLARLGLNDDELQFVPTKSEMRVIVNALRAHDDMNSLRAAIRAEIEALIPVPPE
jgi:hypothetical protein